MREILFATQNPHKMEEIKAILAPYPFRLCSLCEAGFCESLPPEEGETFVQNALQKARFVWRLRGGIVMADDSGLEIDYLNKEPGVYSARYMGEDTPYSIKNAELIRRLAGVPAEKRSARFFAALACILEDGRELVETAVMEGRIAEAPAGEEGFGYDPILFLPEYKKTSAQISMKEKNTISHRGKALRQMGERLLHENPGFK